MICITVLHLYSFILIFTSKDLNKYKHKFIKRTIDQFSIGIYCKIVAGKLFNSSVNSFKTKLLRSFINGVFACNFHNSNIGPFKPRTSPNFVADLFFNTTDVFLFFDINVIFVYCATPWCN